MLNGLLIFLIGALVLAVCVYVCKLLLDMFELPQQVKTIALLILGLIGLILLIILVMQAFGGGIVIVPSGPVIR